jgi:hypothetical protein
MRVPRLGRAHIEELEFVLLDADTVREHQQVARKPGDGGGRELESCCFRHRDLLVLSLEGACRVEAGVGEGEALPYRRLGSHHSLGSLNAVAARITLCNPTFTHPVACRVGKARDNRDR